LNIAVQLEGYLNLVLFTGQGEEAVEELFRKLADFELRTEMAVGVSVFAVLNLKCDQSTQATY
jgi:hypothetical protein